MANKGGLEAFLESSGFRTLRLFANGQLEFIYRQLVGINGQNQI